MKQILEFSIRVFNSIILNITLHNIRNLYGKHEWNKMDLDYVIYFVGQYSTLPENICQTCIFLTFNFHLMNGYYHLKALVPFHAQLNMGTNDNEN